ncbi:MAG: hypothetical protein AABX65_03405 [Nanoarchaeota archaeon]
MSKIYSLDEISRQNSIVLVDNCILSPNVADSFRRNLFDYLNPKIIGIFAVNIYAVAKTLLDRENFAITPEIAQEYEELRSSIKRALQGLENILNRDNHIKISLFHSKNHVNGATLILSNKHLSWLYENSGIIKEVLESRFAVNSVYEELFPDLKELAVRSAQIVAERNADNPRLALSKNGNRNDESLVAAGFCYSLSGVGSAAILTNDSRIPLIYTKLHHILTGDYGSEINANLFDSLSDLSMNVFLGTEKAGLFEQVEMPRTGLPRDKYIAEEDIRRVSEVDRRVVSRRAETIVNPSVNCV